VERTLHHRLGRRAALLSAALLSGLVVGVFPAQAAPAADAANASAVAAVPDHAPAVGWRILTAVEGDVTLQGWTWIR